MKQISKWYYDEFKQVGVNYADIEEVQAYDLRMQKLRNIKQECEYIRGLHTRPGRSIHGHGLTKKQVNKNFS
jgi:hypothetical protein